MAKADLGTKRLCPNCGTRYYDLGKSPPVCPKCGTPFEAASAKPSPKEVVAAEPAAVAAEAKQEVAEKGPEVISLEEADQEVTSGTKADEDDEDEDIKIGGDEDDAFLEQVEDEENNVTNIIGEVDGEET